MTPGKVDPARLTALIEAYAEALTKAVRADPEAFKLQPEDTPESKALRVALKSAWLIENYGIGAVMWQNSTFDNACRALGVSHSEEAIQAYLEGRK